MKKLYMMVAVLGMFALAACGGSSSDGTAQDAINNSANGFGNIIDTILDNPGSCTAKTLLECPCPTSGTVDVDDATYDMTFNNCVSDGLTYSGTVQTDATGSSVTVNMSQFGECTNVTGTITGADVDNCSGTLTGTCAGETVTCTMDSTCETCTINTTSTDSGSTGVPALAGAFDEYMSSIFGGDHILNAPTACSGAAPDLTNCPCPSSGTFDWDLGTHELIYATCTASDGLPFTGTVQQSAPGSNPFNISFSSMTQFGLCTDVTGSVALDPTSSTPACTSGSLSGTCPAAATAGTPSTTEVVNCTIAADCTCS